jgi:excinuclease UvrABC ATPase subunit
MSDTIEFLGIETHNLKNINVTIKKKCINLVIGPSGSGKSSLAYDTIAQIGQHEFLSMFADDVSEPTYRVKTYHNMIAAVPIQQSNHNNNMRSTIGTYFGLNRNVTLVYAASLGLNEDLFVLNKEGNLCEYCHGLGFTKVLDENRVVDYNTPLEQNPIECWNKYKDFYAQIIKQFCSDYGIDARKNFRQLSEKEKKLFLFGESDSKYSIRYKKTNMFSRRTTKFYGIMTGMPMMTNFSPSSKYFADKECEHCHGRKYSSDHEQYILFGLSIGLFMTTPFEKLCRYVNEMMSDVIEPRLAFALKNIYSFLEKAVELNLGHLFFHRAIPTLSGGELQRLRLVQVFNTQLSDLLIVLDEPLAGLSGTEKNSVYRNILTLSNYHTLVIVEHSDIFVKDAKVVIALGKKSGKEGGSIIDAGQYLKTQRVDKEFTVDAPKKSVSITLNNHIYQYTGVSICIAIDCLNLITGKSGVGKSTLLREYLPQYFNQYLYINQKPLLGNKNSSVATVLNIFGLISNDFARKHKKDKLFFSNLTGCEGACPICSGAGFLEYGSEQSTITHLECGDCEGTGFHKNLRKYKLFDKNIYDIWGMTIDEAYEYFLQIDKKIVKVLQDASAIMLGHLRLGQPTATLSGGENIRIKILKSAKSTAKVLGIDEPFRGLSNTEIYCVVRFLEQLKDDNKTVIVVDHNENAFRYFVKHIRLKDENGLLMGFDI